MHLVDYFFCVVLGGNGFHSSLIPVQEVRDRIVVGRQASLVGCDVERCIIGRNRN